MSGIIGRLRKFVCDDILEKKKKKELTFRKYFFCCCCMKDKPPLFPPSRRYISNMDLKRLPELTKFSESDIDMLNAIFICKQKDRTMDIESFFSVFPKDNRMYLSHKTACGKRLFSIFDVSKLGRLNFFGFALGISVMCNCSEYLGMAQVLFDIKATFSDFDEKFYDPEVYIKLSKLLPYPLDLEKINEVFNTAEFLPVRKSFVLDHKKMVREFTENTFFPNQRHT